MVQCSAFGCKSRSERHEEGITFHRFPLKNSERNNTWMKNMKLAHFEANKNNRLCSKHFEAHWFYNAGQRTGLLDQAVPTIFMELPEHLQKSTVSNSISIGEITEESVPLSEPLALTPDATEYTPRTNKLCRLSFNEVLKNNRKILIGDVEKESVPANELLDATEDIVLSKRISNEILKSKIKSVKIKRLGETVSRYKKTIIALKAMVRDLEAKNPITRENVLLTENMDSEILGVC